MIFESIFILNFHVLASYHIYFVWYLLQLCLFSGEVAQATYNFKGFFLQEFHYRDICNLAYIIVRYIVMVCDLLCNT